MVLALIPFQQPIAYRDELSCGKCGIVKANALLHSAWIECVRESDALLKQGIHIPYILDSLQEMFFFAWNIHEVA